MHSHFTADSLCFSSTPSPVFIYLMQQQPTESNADCRMRLQKVQEANTAKQCTSPPCLSIGLDCAERRILLSLSQLRWHHLCMEYRACCVQYLTWLVQVYGSQVWEQPCQRIFRVFNGHYVIVSQDKGVKQRKHNSKLSDFSPVPKIIVSYVEQFERLTANRRARHCFIVIKAQEELLQAAQGKKQTFSSRVPVKQKWFERLCTWLKCGLCTICNTRSSKASFSFKHPENLLTLGYVFTQTSASPIVESALHRDNSLLQFLKLQRLS